MTVTIPLVVCASLLLLLIGYLLGRSSPDRPDVEWLWNELMYFQSRIEPLKAKVMEMTALYTREKQRAAWLKHRLREANRARRREATYSSFKPATTRSGDAVVGIAEENVEKGQLLTVRCIQTHRIGKCDRCGKATSLAIGPSDYRCLPCRKSEEVADVPSETTEGGGKVAVSQCYCEDCGSPADVEVGGAVFCSDCAPTPGPLDMNDPRMYPKPSATLRSRTAKAPK